MVEALEEQHGVELLVERVDEREVALQHSHRRVEAVGPSLDQLHEVGLDVDRGQVVAQICATAQRRVPPAGAQLQDTAAGSQVHRADDVADGDEVGSPRSAGSR